LRFAGSADGYTQRIVDQDVTTLRPRGHAEVLLSASERVHFLPRLSVDGFATNARALSPGRLDVDDDVWSLTRAQRPFWTSAQVLGAVLPARDLALQARPRVTFDAASGSLLSTSGRLSALLSLGRVDLGTAIDTTRWEPLPLVLREATWHTRVSTYAVGSIAVSSSLLIEPGARASLRVDDGRWEGHAFVSLVLSDDRDKSDYSREDLGSFDAFAGTVAWRGKGQPR
jgi:hypothetical protein